MSINESEARIKARVWQGIAEANLDLSGTPKETVEQLVQIVAESALLELDDEIGKSLESEKISGRYDTDRDEDEKILWEGRPFLSLTLYYKITDERLLITEGLFGKSS